jgi:hypothetical protein
MIRTHHTINENWPAYPKYADLHETTPQNWGVPVGYERDRLGNVSATVQIQFEPAKEEERAKVHAFIHKFRELLIELGGEEL